MHDKQKNILLGVTGSIAAYKAVDIARRLMDEGASVRVVMTHAACKFITPLTFEAVTGSPVLIDLFSGPFSHINLSKEADLLLIAPATANTINKLRCGIADDLLGNLCLTHEGRTVIAPAMNHRMYRHPTVQDSIKELKKSGVQFIGPSTGSLACGEEGEGRMADVSAIVEAAVTALTPKDLSRHNILVTAGPTIEPIDPVRYISNRSSGKMGFAVARAAARRGATVTLISGPVSLPQLENVTFIPVKRASEMEAAVLKRLPKATAVIMAAAVADFAPAAGSSSKLGKDDISTIALRKTPDILKKVGSKKGKRILIGFAAETGRDVESAKNKLKQKNLDIIVLNDVTQKGAGFDVDTNVVTIIDGKGKIAEYPLLKKIEVANIILDRMLELATKAQRHKGR
ncbi:MAG: bifunctional phosphopantothenoylcysteine decarboxylase/phosphopantothenate--cysteine ligase CoaBC [Nitrospirae bacterium]|nr:bifunctional phosphopantothenoylcysteine decarboxylase/phosphopantothenate--cysteine ligase CoaBC [Nitrospirota bacterium]